MAKERVTYPVASYRATGDVVCRYTSHDGRPEEIAIKVERTSIGCGAVYLKCRPAQTAARVGELFSPSMRHDHVAAAVARLQRRNSSPTSSDRQRILTAEATSSPCHRYISRGSISLCEVLRSL